MPVWRSLYYLVFSFGFAVFLVQAETNATCNSSPLFVSRFVPRYTMLQPVDNPNTNYLFVGQTLSGLVILQTPDSSDIAVKAQWVSPAVNLHQLSRETITEALAKKFCASPYRFQGAVDCSLFSVTDSIMDRIEVLGFLFGSDSSILTVSFFFNNRGLKPALLAGGALEAKVFQTFMLELASTPEPEGDLKFELSLVLNGNPVVLTKHLIAVAALNIGVRDLTNFQVNCATYPDSMTEFKRNSSLSQAVFGQSTPSLAPSEFQAAFIKTLNQTKVRLLPVFDLIQAISMPVPKDTSLPSCRRLRIAASILDGEKLASSSISITDH